MSRELDAALAIAFGGMKWVNNATGSCRYIVPVEMDHGSPPADMTLPLCGMWNPRTPHYSTDLNECRLAEQRMIELGHGDAYVMALERQLDLSVDLYAEGNLVKLLTAPAEARCKAMLSVLEDGARHAETCEGEGK